MLQCQPGPFPDPESALAAWRRSFYGAVLDTADRPRLVLEDDHVLTDPAGATARLVAFCRAYIPDYTPPADMPEQIARSVMPYVHHQAPDAILPPATKPTMSRPMRPSSPLTRSA